MATNRTAAEYGLAIVIVLTIQAIAFGTQQRISTNGGRGFDGSNYYELASQLRAGEPPRGEWRFARRVGTPLLAAAIGGDDLIGAFQVINACAAFASALLLLAWLRRYLDSSWLRLALVAIYATHWLQLVRFTAFYPVLVDACAQTCCFAGLHLIASYEKQPAGWKVALVSLVSVGGVLVREAALLIPLAFLFVRNPGVRLAAGFPYVRLTNVAHLTPWIPIVLAGTALTLVDRYVVATDAEFSASRHLLARASSRSVLTFGLGWLVAFGPALFLVLFDWRAVSAFFGRHKWMAAYIAGVAAIGWAGSLESERHALNWGAPVVFALLGRSVVRHGLWPKRWLALSLILFAQLLVNRVFWSVPQPGDGGSPAMVLTPVGSATTYLYLFPDYLPRDVALLQLMQHLAVGVVILAVMQWMTTRPVQRTPVGPGVTEILVRRRTTAEACRALTLGLRQFGMLAALRVLVLAFAVTGGAGGLMLLSAQPARPVPIHVRWTADVDDYRRAALERELQLTDGNPTEGTTWSYLLTDPSTDRIRTIVTHPDVEDTEHLNRVWFRPRFSYDRERRALFYGALVGGAGSIVVLLGTAAFGFTSSARTAGRNDEESAQV